MKNPIMLDDTSLMPFGQYKGTPMSDVPVGYLHWYWHNGEPTHSVYIYIRKNIDALKMENKDLIW